MLGVTQTQEQALAAAERESLAGSWVNTQPEEGSPARIANYREVRSCAADHRRQRSITVPSHARIKDVAERRYELRKKRGEIRLSPSMVEGASASEAGTHDWDAMNAEEREALELLERLDDGPDVLAAVHAVDAPPATRLSQREVTELEQRRVVIETRAAAKRFYFFRLNPKINQASRIAMADAKAERDPQYLAAKAHAAALKQRQLFRERCQAYGLKNPTRETLALVAELMGAGKTTYEAVNGRFEWHSVGKG